MRILFALEPRPDPFLRMEVERSSSPVAADGRFELVVPAGDVRLLLSLADIRTGRFFGGPGSSRQELATVTLAEGEELERDFEVPSPPGTLVLEMTLNGAAAPGLPLRLDSHGQSILGQTDSAGTFGPRIAFAGSWILRVGDAHGEWSHAWPEPIEIAPGVETRRSLALELATARIVLVDRETGAPHAHRRVGVFADQRRIGQPLLTEADGGLSLTLTPGYYQFVLNPGETAFPPAEARRSDTLTWGARGPGVEHVSL